MNIIKRAARIFSKTPAEGEAVWWAPKQVGGIVTLNSLGEVTFQCGPIVKNKRGRQVPRWTVSVHERWMRWSPGIDAWVVGQGPVPKKRSSDVLFISPKAVQLSGKAKGSFANG